MDHAESRRADLGACSAPWRKPRIVLTRTQVPSKSHRTTEAWGSPVAPTVDSAASGGHSTRSRCDSGISSVAPSASSPTT
jgi:hypothetical protein